LTRVRLELLRIRSIRAQLISLVEIDIFDTQKMRQLVALDRYERIAHNCAGDVGPRLRLGVAQLLAEAISAGCLSLGTKRF